MTGLIVPTLDVANVYPRHLLVGYGLEPCVAVVVERYAVDLEALAVILGVCVDEEGNLTHAGAAPRCPEVDEHILVALGLDNALERNLLAVGILLRDVDIGLSGLRLEGVLGLGLDRGERILRLDGEHGHDVEDLLRLEVVIHLLEEGLSVEVVRVGADGLLDDNEELILNIAHLLLVTALCRRLELVRQVGHLGVELGLLVVHGRALGHEGRILRLADGDVAGLEEDGDLEHHGHGLGGVLGSHGAEEEVCHCGSLGSLALDFE